MHVEEFSMVVCNGWSIKDALLHSIYTISSLRSLLRTPPKGAQPKLDHRLVDYASYRPIFARGNLYVVAVFQPIEVDLRQYSYQP
jgi:hypothetical protein